MQVMVMNVYIILYPVIVKSAWVEIPQVPNQNPEFPQQFPSKRPTQFVFGAPKVSFINQEPTTPSYRTMLATPEPPSTTVANYNYKSIMTTSTVSPLTTPRMIQSDRKPTPESIARKEYATEPNSKSKSSKSEETYSGIMPLLQSIQETLTINAKKSLKSKISLLTKLKDNLLANIDDRMSSLWKKSDEILEPRGYDDHEMDFPSNEGALMTIGFLTFAVFLIKLVLKLIHALKSKHNAMVVTTMAPSVAAFIGRKKRQLEDDDLKILQYIDEYKFT